MDSTVLLHRVHVPCKLRSDKKNYTTNLQKTLITELLEETDDTEILDV